MQLSIVIPVRDEAENLRPLFAEIEQVMKGVGGPWELWFVDDGSNDASYEIIAELAEQSAAVHCIRFDRNYGKTAALAAAIERVRGDVVLLMDGDGQNDPRDIPRFVEACRDHDVVCGVRSRRHDSRFRIWQSRIAFRVRNWVTGDGAIDSGGGFQAYRRSLLVRVPLFEGMHRFLPFLAQQQGASMTQIEVHHRPRRHGDSKYPFWSRLSRTAPDLIAARWMLSRWIRYRIRDER